MRGWRNWSTSSEGEGSSATLIRSLWPGNCICKDTPSIHSTQDSDLSAVTDLSLCFTWF